MADIIRITIKGESGYGPLDEAYSDKVTIDRDSAQIVMMGSADGGMEIENVAREHPDHIFYEYVDPAVGLEPFQTRRLAYRMQFPENVINKVAKTMENMYQLFVEKDCSLAETNPLVLTTDNRIVAADAKLNFDDSAIYRHPEIYALRDENEEDPKERAAAKASLSYVNLGGDVACMVNGAGLAMATVDLIKFYGGEPANFLDVGGDSTVDAGGIVEAAKVVGLQVPVIARLDGTNVAEGRKILAEAKLPMVHSIPRMEEGAELAVKLAAETKQKLAAGKEA